MVCSEQLQENLSHREHYKYFIQLPGGILIAISPDDKKQCDCMLTHTLRFEMVQSPTACRSAMNPVDIQNSKSWNPYFPASIPHDSCGPFY